MIPSRAIFYRAGGLLSAAMAVLWPAATWAQEQGATALPATDFTTALMKMLAALALVLAVVVGLYWLSRRLMPGKVAGAGSGMRVLGRLGLGGRKSVVMVEAAGKVLVLGVAGDRVNLLCEVEDPEEISELTRAKGLGFAKILQKAKGEQK